MQLLKLKPTSNGTRHQVKIQKNILSKTNKFSKNTIFGLKKCFGRSTSTGRVTVRHWGGGCKKSIRELNFTNNPINAIVICIMYDPLRSSFVSLNFDLNRFSFFRTLSTNLVYCGSLFFCSTSKSELKLNNRLQLNDIPSGSVIHSLSMNNKTKYVRSAGTFCQLIQKNLANCYVKMPSGIIKSFPINTFGTLGSVSNFQHNLVCLGKAGKNRLKGKRPSVRGIAMNPVDHPHGGKSNGGMPSVTPWGIPTKGKPTVSKK